MLTDEQKLIQDSVARFVQDNYDLETRRKLAEQAKTTLPGAAVPVKPVPQRMLAPVPQSDANAQRPARIQIAPDQAKATPAQSEAVVHQK